MGSIGAGKLRTGVPVTLSLFEITVHRYENTGRPKLRGQIVGSRIYLNNEGDVIQDATSGPSVRYVVLSRFNHIEERRIRRWITSLSFLFLFAIALPPILNPRNPARSWWVSLGFDILSGMIGFFLR